MTRSASGLLLLVFAASSLLATTPPVIEHPCRQPVPNARCGSIQVPENRARPRSRMISIEFVQVRSTAKHTEPDAFLDVSGGPGIPSTPSAGFMVPIFAYVLRHRDLVIYDQRGTGASNFLHCDLHEGMSASERADFLPEQAVRECYRSTSARADVAQYNTAASVQDLDDLRAALGYDKLTLHALSYGTTLSQAYMQAHPEHVRAAIFEGAVQPGMRIPLGFAVGMQRSLEGVLDDCRHEPDCHALAQKIDLDRFAGIAKLTFQEGGVTIRVTSGQLFEALRTLLYDADSARRLPLILGELSQGDKSSLAGLYEAMDRDDAAFSWPLWLSTICAEDTPFIPERLIAPATRNTLAGDYRIRQQQRACRSWRVPKHDPAIGKPAKIPILLMEGKFDPVTPPWKQQDLLRYFPVGRQIVIPHAGHLLVGLEGIECIDMIEDQFLTSLDPNALDTSCLNGVRRKPFLLTEEGATH